MIQNRIPKYVAGNGMVMAAKTIVTSNSYITFSKPCRLSASRAIIAYSYGSSPYGIYARIVYTNGATITLGAQFTVAGGSNISEISLVRITDTKAVISWMVSYTSYYCVLNVSTNTITAGTTYSGLATLVPSTIHDSVATSSTQFMLYSGNQNYTGQYLQLFNVSGNVITLAAETNTNITSLMTNCNSGEIYNCGTNEYLLGIVFTSGSNYYRGFQVVGLSGTTFNPYTLNYFSQNGVGYTYMRKVAQVSLTRYMYIHSNTNSLSFNFVDIAGDKTIVQDETHYGSFDYPIANYSSVSSFDNSYFFVASQGVSNLPVYLSNFKNPKSETRFYSTNFTDSLTNAYPATVALSSNLGLVFCQSLDNYSYALLVQAVMRN